VLNVAESLIHNVMMLTSTPREGAKLQFVCTFRYIFAQRQVRLRRFVWYLNGARLSDVNSDRLEIETVEPDLKGTWVSTLTFNRASAKDSGMYNYNYSYNNNNNNNNKS